MNVGDKIVCHTQHDLIFNVGDIYSIEYLQIIHDKQWFTIRSYMHKHNYSQTAAISIDEYNKYFQLASDDLINIKDILE